MKLNMACGRYDKNYPFDDWVNLDIEKRPGYKKFVIHDATKPFTMFEDETFDVVFSEHFLEHLDMHEASVVTLEAHRMLKKGGIYRVVVPDAILRKDEPPEKFPTENNHRHKTAWTFPTLKWLLEGAGFNCRPVQYWEESGQQFSTLDFDESLGKIRRRNSLIIDGIK